MKRTLDKVGVDTKPANEPRHLFLAVDSSGEHREFGVGIQRFVYTPNPETDWVFRELVSDMDEIAPSYIDEEDGKNHLDTLNYLCNEWTGERPPSALPSSLWFTPRAQLGKWERLEYDDNYVRVNQGPWLSVLEVMVDFREEDEHETRMIEKEDWAYWLADAEEQERKKEKKAAVVLVNI